MEHGARTLKQAEWAQRLKTNKSYTPKSLESTFKAKPTSKKRQLDAVDLESMDKQTTQRSKFSNRERDMVCLVQVFLQKDLKSIQK